MKTNKQLALENLKGIAYLMEKKCQDDSAFIILVNNQKVD